MTGQLVALPHSGLRVPHTDLRVTSAQTMPGSDGDMISATLQLKTKTVGHVLNEGRGGATYFQPSGTSFGWRDLHAYADACRNPAGEPVTEEQVLDLLVDEYRTGKDVTWATKAGHTALRQCVLINGLTYRIGLARCRPISTDAQRAKLIAELAANQPDGDGEWWQLWTGDAWDNLTDPPTTDGS